MQSPVDAGCLCRAYASVRKLEQHGGVGGKLPRLRTIGQRDRATSIGQACRPTCGLWRGEHRAIVIADTPKLLDEANHAGVRPAVQLDLLIERPAAHLAIIRRGRIAAQQPIGHRMVERIAPKTVHAPVEPKPRAIQKGFLHHRQMHVELRLLLQECVRITTATLDQFLGQYPSSVYAMHPFDQVLRVGKKVGVSTWIG